MASLHITDCTRFRFRMVCKAIPRSSYRGKNGYGIQLKPCDKKGYGPLLPSYSFDLLAHGQFIHHAS